MTSFFSASAGSVARVTENTGAPTVTAPHALPSPAGLRRRGHRQPGSPDRARPGIVRRARGTRYEEHGWVQHPLDVDVARRFLADVPRGRVVRHEVPGFRKGDA